MLWLTIRRSGAALLFALWAVNAGAVCLLACLAAPSAFERTTAEGSHECHGSAAAQPPSDTATLFAPATGCGQEHTPVLLAPAKDRASQRLSATAAAGLAFVPPSSDRLAAPRLMPARGSGEPPGIVPLPLRI